MRRALFILAMLPAASCAPGGGSPAACHPYPPPAVLSETGCYEDAATQNVISGAIPYQLNSPLWSDGAVKKRYIVLPGSETIGWREHDSWDMPVGTVLMKEFFLEGPSGPFPVETRLLVRVQRGAGANDWVGSSYRWREDGLDADLQQDGMTASYVGTEGTEPQRHVFPAQSECLRCHNAAAGGPLGLQTGNMNRDLLVAGVHYGVNQLAEMNERGLFGNSFPARSPTELPRMVDPADESVPAEARARSYLHANCVHCHRAGSEMGTRIWGPFDLPLAETDLCKMSSDGVTPIVAPGNALGSKLYQRDNDPAARMPPIATLMLDPTDQAVLIAWIDSMSTCQ